MKKWLTGTSGFYNRHWKGIFYPENLPQKSWFTFYCEQFKTIELNVTFYRFPTEKMLMKWHDESPDDFSFSIKAPQIITHYKRFNECERLLDDLYLVCDKGLKHKMGTLLFQFPASFQYNEEILEKICRSLRKGFNNVIEFRHASWWRKDVFERLKEDRIIFCNINYPNLSQDLIINSEKFYMRLHGNPHLFYTAYSNESIKNLFTILEEQNDLKEISIYFNNTAGTAGILNAMEIKTLIQDTDSNETELKLA